MVKNPPANAGNTGSSPGPGRSHMPRSNQARAPQLLSLCSRAVSHNYWARAPRACALQQEKPPQWEARAPQQSSPRSPQLEKARVQQRRPNAAKNKLINT